MFARTDLLSVSSSFRETSFRTTHCLPWSEWIATQVSRSPRVSIVHGGARMYAGNNHEAAQLSADEAFPVSNKAR